MTGIGRAPTVAVVLVAGDRELALRVTGDDADAGPHCLLAFIDCLLRLHLAARRHGWSLRLTAADDDLRELLDLVGLDRFGSVT